MANLYQENSIKASIVVTVSSNFNRVTANIWNGHDSSVKASIVVTNSYSSGEVMANIWNGNENSVKANIWNGYDNAAKANIIVHGAQDSSAKANIKKLDNLVIANIQSGDITNTIPETVKNMTIGDPTQPGVTTFYDDNTEQFVDFKGLVSTTNFQYGYVEVNSQQDTTSGTTVDVTSMSLTFTLERDANVFFFATVSGLNLNGSSGLVLMYLSPTPGTQIGPAMFIPGSLNFTNGGVAGTHAHTAMNSVTTGVAFIRQLAATTHTVKLVYNSVVGGATTRLVASPRVLGYIVLGK